MKMMRHESDDAAVLPGQTHQAGIILFGYAVLAILTYHL